MTEIHCIVKAIGKQRLLNIWSEPQARGMQFAEAEEVEPYTPLAATNCRSGISESGGNYGILSGSAWLARDPDRFAQFGGIGEDVAEDETGRRRRCIIM